MEKARAERLRNPAIVTKLASLLNEYENDPEAWHVLLQVGEIYMRGEFPTYIPNTQLAQDLFRVALTCPRGPVSGIAQSRYIESRVSVMDTADMAGVALPDIYGLRMIRIAKHRIQHLPPNAFETPAPASTPRAPPRANEPARASPNRPAIPPPRAAANDPPPAALRIVNNDLQNVHDHSVTCATKHILQRIQRDVEPHASSRAEVETALLDSTLGDEEKIRALAVIDSLTTETEHSSLKMTETDALNLVWSKIQSMEIQSMKTNVTETLLHQLASGVENGFVVCSTGKIARIVGALDGLGNDDFVVRPMWAVREELGTMASKKRGCGDCSEERSRELRREFVDEANALYCKDLGLKPSIMEPLISLYADAI